MSKEKDTKEATTPKEKVQEGINKVREALDNLESDINDLKLCGC